jgi:hypothetical protein
MVKFHSCWCKVKLTASRVIKNLVSGELAKAGIIKMRKIRRYAKF